MEQIKDGKYYVCFTCCDMKHLDDVTKCSDCGYYVCNDCCYDYNEYKDVEWDIDNAGICALHTDGCPMCHRLKGIECFVCNNRYNLSQTVNCNICGYNVCKDCIYDHNMDKDIKLNNNNLNVIINNRDGCPSCHDLKTKNYYARIGAKVILDHEKNKKIDIIKEMERDKQKVHKMGVEMEFITNST